MKIYRGTYPRSSELYHHGILGQKWGVRRFQNPDGSLTPEGRERYGSGSSSSVGERIKTGARHVGKAVGKVAKATGKYAVRKVKERHPSLMSKEELDEYVLRLASEKRLRDIRHDLRGPGLGDAGKFIGDILSSGAKTLADAGFRKLASNMTKSSEEREIDDLELANKRKELIDKLTGSNKKNLNWAENVANNPNDYDYKDIATAAKIYEDLGKINKSSGNESKQRDGSKNATSSSNSKTDASGSDSYKMRSLSDMENDYPAGFSGSRYESRTIKTPLKYIELSNQKRAESSKSEEYRPAKVVFEEPEAKAAIRQGEDFIATIWSYYDDYLN